MRGVREAEDARQDHTTRPCILQRTDIDDIPHLADLLRTTFKEYQRRQRGPFLKQVERAAQLARQAKPDPEALLQVIIPHILPLYAQVVQPAPSVRRQSSADHEPAIAGPKSDMPTV